MTSHLDPLMVKIQTQLLRATFIKNMATLKEWIPSVYDYYVNYTPKKIQLGLDNNGKVNLIANGEFVYKDDPKSSSLLQVNKFLKKPPHFNFDIPVSASRDYNYEHERVINELFDKRRELLGNNAQQKLQQNDQINFLAVMGSGLGYHLEDLFEKFSIRSAFIYEPEPDCFFATLHCIDLAPLLEHCRKLGGEFTLKIGGSEDEYVNEINISLKRIGYFNISKMYLYRHYLSNKTKGAFELINEIAYRYRSGWGFCEDEVIGISHTLSNISQNNFPTILRSAKLTKREQPIFVIGNGPSLDYSFEYLKNNQESAVIISCGTALKPLLDKGIIPDLHIEQERPAMIYDWIKKVGHEEQLKKIDLICLNTVYPRILHCFKQAHVILKPGDAGTAFIQNIVSDKYAEIYNTNPTVTNAGTAAAIAMGFKNLYLFGIDYGFKDETHHHSKDSLWYKDNEGLKEANIKGDFNVPGNFGGEVSTTRVFDRSRGVLELLLQDNPDVICVNSSDGALIKLSASCQIENLPNFKKLKTKEAFIAKLLRLSFSNKDYKQRDLNSEFKALMPLFRGYIDILKLLSSQAINCSELTNAFANQYQFVNDLEENKSKKLFHRFMGGTLNYIQASIMHNVFCYSDKLQQQQYIQYAIETMNAHFEWLYHDIEKNYDQPAKV